MIVWVIGQIIEGGIEPELMIVKKLMNNYKVEFFF